MVDVNLADDIYLVSDSHQFTIVKRRYNEKKEEYYDQPIGFFGTLEQVIEAFARIREKSIEATSLKELKEGLDRIKKEVEKVKKELANV